MQSKSSKAVREATPNLESTSAVRLPLRRIYEMHAGKVSDKWSTYLPAYDRIFSHLREKPVRLLEIGVQNGGSLEIWQQYFPNASLIVGCDIDDACSKLEFSEKNIKVVVGDINKDTTEIEIAKWSDTYDIIIDDGSHESSDVIRSLCRYFKYLSKPGIYAVEDIHCSYWNHFGGGLYDPFSSMSFLKRLLDVVNYEHWGLDCQRTDALAGFTKKYGISLSEASLASISSIEFQNSLCFLTKIHREENILGRRRLAGQDALVDGTAVNVSGSFSKTPDQSENPWSLNSVTMEEEVVHNRELARRYPEQERENVELKARLKAKESKSASLQATLERRSIALEEIRQSTSWRITSPLRRASTIAREFGRKARAVLHPPRSPNMGLWREVARPLLSKYQRTVPRSVKGLVPRRIAEALKRRIDGSEPIEIVRRFRSPRTLLARLRQDMHRQARSAGRPTPRIAVFASYSSDGRINKSVLYYLSELKKVVDRIIFVSDSEITAEELRKLDGIVHHKIASRHGEYDFGSYKRGYLYAKESGLLEQDPDLILCNDSCFGPVRGFENLMLAMDLSGYDFWGITESNQFRYHLQSYFLYFSSSVYKSFVFNEFIASVKKEKTVQDVIRNYELRLTDILIENGFRAKAFIAERPATAKTTSKHVHVEHFPCFMVEQGSPLIKVKSLTKARCNLDGIGNTLEFLKRENNVLYEGILEMPAITRFLDCEKVSFSIVMPTLNRGHCIDRAIASVLSQSHRNFELVIADDGSSDGTEEMIRRRYRDEIASGKIIYLPSEGHGGVSAARNRGLRAAKNEWIAYLDTDNTIRPNFLSMYAQSVVEHPEAKTFYAEFQRTNDGVIVGKSFSYAELFRGNFIDLGVFVHHRDCVAARGGFDENLKRLVDWDLILNYTDAYPPHYIPHVLMDYSDEPDSSRVSIKEALSPAWFYVLAKRKRRPTVSTVILCYNQSQYIAEAIESAVRQKGEFDHEIIISDDGSTDGTYEIVKEYVRRYPDLIRDVSLAENRGISANYRHGLSAAGGEFVAILEGDDYWLDDGKLEAQVAFLLHNRDCSMVFSKIHVHNLKSDTVRTLSRQDAIKKNKLNGRDFLDHPTMNLIGTFSTCMFRKGVLNSFPPVLFEKRISEIPVAFFHDNHGRIGYLGDPMTLYRQHATGVWTSSSPEDQKRSGRDTRMIAKAVAREIYKHEIQQVIDERYSD